MWLSHLWNYSNDSQQILACRRWDNLSENLCVLFVAVRPSFLMYLGQISKEVQEVQNFQILHSLAFICDIFCQLSIVCCSEMSQHCNMYHGNCSNTGAKIWPFDHTNAKLLLDTTFLHSVSATEVNTSTQRPGGHCFRKKNNKQLRFAIPNHKPLLDGGFVLQMFELTGKEEDGQLHRDSCFNLVFPSVNLILPVQPNAHIALFYWMLDLRVIDRQSDGLSCEAVRSFNMHNDQQQLSQSVACLTKQ